jgi:peptide/nickel transport system substrate-binding protein
MVVPDENTIALELRKGSADAAINAVNADVVLTLQREPHLAVLRAPGTVIAYLTFNLRDPILRDVRVRQAIAYAIDRQPIVEYLLRGFAQPAKSVLPPQSWAYDGEVPSYNHDPARARQLLDAAGYGEENGVRFHLTMKTSSQESTRLLVAVLQQQLRDVGIVLDIRTFEFATFYADVSKGLFQLYSMRWIGGNEDPDIFEYVFHSSKVPPKGGNRGFYQSARVDALIDQARREIDPHVRKELYAEIQQILAEEVPALNLWYPDNVLICNRRVKNVVLGISGDYNFLRTVEIEPGDRRAERVPPSTLASAPIAAH